MSGTISIQVPSTDELPQGDPAIVTTNRRQSSGILAGVMLAWYATISRQNG